MKKLVAIILVGVLVLFGAISTDWTKYFLQLATHQLYIWTHTENIHTLNLESFSSDEKDKLLLLEEAKLYGKNIYNLNKSKSYETFVNLHRKVLGWNLSMSPELKLEEKKFYFPFMGSFSYIGFFNEQLKEEWKTNFKKKGFDVHESRIGGYSTLGYLIDPLFSTYLQFPDVYIVSLVMHELSHERLYFKNDSTFSESLSSFIEREATKRFYKQIKNKEMPVKSKVIARRELSEFLNLINDTEKKLTNIYEGDSLKPEKIKSKKVIFNQLRAKLRILENKFKYNSLPKYMLELEEINNATLFQVKRYNPPSGGSFQLLLDDCDQDLMCWFSKLEHLKKCSSEIRITYLTETIKLDKLLKSCPK